MIIASFEKVDISAYGKTSKGDVYAIHVQIEDVSEMAKKMTNQVLDKSWIAPLKPASKLTYSARSEATIKELSENIFNLVDDKVTEQFGEYLITASAQDSLVHCYRHKLIPISELWKEKVSNNHGFDFHSLSQNELITFGESKFNSNKSSYADALEQIIRFIAAKKDFMDLNDLQNLSSKKSISNMTKGKRGFAAAFSINAAKPKLIIENALKSNLIDSLLDYPEVYIIGVEIKRT